MQLPLHLLPFTIFQDVGPYACLHSHYALLDEVLAPWYATYAADDLHPLLALLNHLPYMRRLVAAHSVRFGRLDVLAFLDANVGIASFDDDLIDTAAYYGQLAALAFLHDRGHPGSTYFALDDALIHGHLAVADFLWTHRRGDGSSTRAWEGSAERGQLKSIQWLHEHNVWLCTPETMDRAAEAGHLDIVEYLDRVRTEGCTEMAVVLAAQAGHVDVVQYFLESRQSRHHEWKTRETVTAAYDAGQFEVVALLLSA
ncbi:Aste57867_8730 [Aphanomyces stellatus]|uniref:Aste57867_8730 protein n=1 Tax=Aphanomyces stellatus TaxID=120398 RepID=A0A485KLB4_9STRA|nr:hypothetical protein As57867_008696 [Aphanomyces stellatus]VFT85616.1 Aste57867_8730 [Aphanomyces stellatus]